ncbi:unnamed protein product [Rotaria socialis]|uniref:Envelope protein n=2 Tax=Rotaria socialis TaxID=392032 RepID=A0A821Q854_9BILA|nr:unnamed protein product [Rotaria socialis]
MKSHMISSIVLLIIKLNIVPTLPSPTVMIDADRGFVLDPIGIYSEKLDDSIFHIVIPYNNLCVNSPNSDVCEYIESTDPNVVEIGTLMPYASHVSTKYNKQNISNAIQQDIRRIFLYHQVDKFIAKSKSIIYFVDNHFYVTTHTSRSLLTTSSFVSADPPTLFHLGTSPVTLVLEQVFNNKVGYDFLTDEQISEILSLTVLTTGDVSHDISIKENINTLTNMIIGQTIFALKSCTILHNEIERSGSPCLVVSTVFRRLPAQTSSFYQVYHLTPLPVIFEGEQYVYSNLPQIFGFNNIEKRLVLWNDGNFLASCTFSRVVQCRNRPISIPLSTVTCIDELLGAEFSSISKCLVEKSKNIQSNILNIKNNIWYTYWSDESLECELQSSSSHISDIVSIKGSAIARFPCGRPVRCSNFLLPASACINTTIIVTNKHNNSLNKQPASVISLNNITKRLVSIYKAAAMNTLLKLQMEIDTQRTWINKILEDFGNILLSVLYLSILSILLFVINIIKNKISKKVNYMQTQINRMQKNLLEDV